MKIKAVMRFKGEQIPVEGVMDSGMLPEKIREKIEARAASGGKAVLGKGDMEDVCLCLRETCEPEATVEIVERENGRDF